VITTVDRQELTAKDRCDSCSAAAKVVATFITGELMFCGHHAREMVNTAMKKAITVWDPEDEIGIHRV
jgi:hypothetical protein